MVIDIGSDKKVSGVITQARGNTGQGSMAVTKFKVMHSTEASPSSWTTVPGFFTGPTDAEWNANIDHKVTEMLPEVITGRYVRLVIETHHHGSMAAMRAALLMYTDKTDMFVGKHQFRRCLESDRYGIL